MLARTSSSGLFEYFSLVHIFYRHSLWSAVCWWVIRIKEIKFCIKSCSLKYYLSLERGFIVKFGCSCVLRRLSFAKQGEYQEYLNIRIFLISNTFISRAIIQTSWWTSISTRLSSAITERKKRTRADKEKGTRGEKKGWDRIITIIEFRSNPVRRISFIHSREVTSKSWWTIRETT